MLYCVSVCSDHMYSCSDEVCISNTWVCDGAIDCADDEGESTCGGKKYFITLEKIGKNK